jgi:hyperosmotically inducible periplasmic protein
MNKISKKRFTQPLILSIVLMITLSACTNVAKTASDSPNAKEKNGEVSTSEKAPVAQDDAQSQTRKNQLNADIQAREQRNNIAGDSLKRDDKDLSSEVRSKLEANIPRAKLTVVAKNADITVSGVVMTEGELNKIKSLAMEIKGVNSVMVKAVVNP